MTDLKPCPFCDNEATMSDLEDFDDRRYWQRSIKCHQCSAKISESIGWTEYALLGVDAASDRVGKLAIAAWNTRADLAAERERKLVEALHRISLASQDSGSTKESVGAEACATLKELGYE